MTRPSFLMIVSAFIACLISSHAFSKSGNNTGYRTFIATIQPISITGEPGGRFEFNLYGEASLSVEGTYVPQTEELGKKEIEKNGHNPSMMIGGKQGAVLISRYTNPYELSGFFWSGGLGYRSVEGVWKKTYDPSDTSTSLTQQNNQTYYIGTKDEEDRLAYNFNASGMTLHARGGYRYVGESIPFSIGLHLGLRHFLAKVEDVRDKKNENDPDYSELSEEEMTSIRRRLMDRMEGVVELGIVF